MGNGFIPVRLCVKVANNKTKNYLELMLGMMKNYIVGTRVVVELICGIRCK